MFIFYLGIVIITIGSQNKKDRMFPVIIKSIEAICHLILLSWAVAFLDFSFMGLSYVIMFCVLVLLLFVR